MPAICIDHNGTRRATVNTDRFEVLSVRVHSSCYNEEFARLDFSGGRYGADDKVSLVWINEMPLKAGDEVSLSLVPSAAVGDPGQTPAELFPGYDPDAEFAMPDLDEIRRVLKEKPVFHDAFMFRLDSSCGTHYAGCTRPPEYGFTLSVLWNWLSPEQARLSLTSVSFEDAVQRRMGRDHVREKIKVGDVVSFRMIASSVGKRD